MQVQNLRLEQYRNFVLQEIDFCPGTNLLFGSNGQGKTNLLEAIYLLGYGRSFRTATPKDCIRHEQQRSSVSGKIAHGSRRLELGVNLSRVEDKQLLLFGKSVGLGEFIGSLHVMAFTQEHLKVVRGGPLERRAFLDRGMITAYPSHMRRLAIYGRTLKQRNRMLSEALAGGGRVDEILLESWDEKLVQEGSRIVADRQRYVDEIQEELRQSQWSPETLEIQYASAIAGTSREFDDIETEFGRRLRQRKPVDERRGYTSIGPHRDDLNLMLAGKALGEFGSAGQQRSCLLSLYFAQMEIHRKACGFYPVFLMDDVEAELDDRRLQAFLQHLACRTQTFLTTAKEHALPPLGEDTRKYLVQAGTVHPVTA